MIQFLENEEKCNLTAFGKSSSSIWARNTNQLPPIIEYMTTGEKKSSYWEKRLLQMRAELENLDKEAVEGRQAVELDQSRVGRLSRMDALQGQAMNKAIAERRRATLARIEAALARLEDDEFGYCAICGDKIAEKRLELDPTVSACTRCVK